MPEPEMTPGMYGPDITFAGVPRTTLGALAEAGLDVVFVGAPFDGGTSHPPGTRFGRRPSGRPTTCRMTRRGRTWRLALTRCKSCGSPASAMWSCRPERCGHAVRRDGEVASAARAAGRST